MRRSFAATVLQCAIEERRVARTALVRAYEQGVGLRQAMCRHMLAIRWVQQAEKAAGHDNREGGLWS